MPTLGDAQMARRSPAKVDHSFNGDMKVLNATLDRRREIRQLLTDLQRDLSKIEARPTRVTAKIQIQVSGPDAKEHVYDVSVTDGAFDTSTVFPQATLHSSGLQASSVSASPSLGHANGGRQVSVQSTPTASAKRSFAVEIPDDEPPRKRSRPEDNSSNLSSDTETLIREHMTMLKQRGSKDELFDFINEWHTQWTQQGGWLYDITTKSTTAATNNQTELMKRLNSMQDILGQSMNAQSQSTLTELANITKLVPWLEHCRKTNADKTQAREEKWRSSSATFHDQNRKDREAAEKKLSDQLDAQKKLLEKQERMLTHLLEERGLSGFAAPAEKGSEGEESLTAQLSKELNMEAERAARREKEANAPIMVDDEDD